MKVLKINLIYLAIVMILIIGYMYLKQETHIKCGCEDNNCGDAITFLEKESKGKCSCDKEHFYSPPMVPYSEFSYRSIAY